MGDEQGAQATIDEAEDIARSIESDGLKNRQQLEDTKDGALSYIDDQRSRINGTYYEPAKEKLLRGNDIVISEIKCLLEQAKATAARGATTTIVKTALDEVLE